MKTKTSEYKLLSGLFFRLLPYQVLLLIITSINGIVDTLYASNLIGETAMGAIGLFGPLNHFLYAASITFVSGSQVLYGRYLARERSKIHRLFTVTLVISGLLSFLTSLLLTAGVFLTLCEASHNVRKTTTAVNLGAGLARHNKNILLVDTDAQGDLTKSIFRDEESGYAIEPDTLEYTLATILSKVINDEEINLDEGIIHHWEGYDFVPGNVDLSGLEMTLVSVTFRETILKQYIDQLRDRYDYIIIDCAPSLSMMTVNAIFAADSVLIPVVAEYLPVKGMVQLLNTIKKVKKHYNANLRVEGILLTMMKPRTNLAKDISELLYESYGNDIHIFKDYVPVSIKAAEASAVGKSILSYEPDNKVSIAYQSLTKEVLSNGR